MAITNNPQSYPLVGLLRREPLNEPRGLAAIIDEPADGVEKPLRVTPIDAAAAVVVHELAGLPAVDEAASAGFAPGDGDVEVAVDGEEDEVPIGEAEGVGGLAEGLGVGAVGEPEGDGGREEEGAR
ncbi:hypothetical protein B296_00002520, partial [Ensete ventricosum]